MAGKQASNWALLFILITVFLDTVGLGIIIPVLPKLIAELTGEGIGAAALYGGWLLFVFSGMQFLFAPVIGNLSDRYGRRPVLLISLAALGIDYAITGFAQTIVWLFAARVLSGMAAATYPTANAYIADVSSPEKRAQNFGLIGAAFGLGFIVGPVIGGLLGQFGPRVPFFAAAGLSMLTVAYGYFVVPESLPEKDRRPFVLGRANPFGAFKQLSRFPLVIGLMSVVVLMKLAHDANPAVFTYYVMLKFDWSEAQIGYSMGWVGVMVIFVYGYLTRVVIPRIGETRAVFAGLSLGAIGFAGYALATEGWMMYVAITVWALFGLAGPALRAIMSNQVGADQQGELQGGIASLESLTAIAAPLLLTQVFWYFTSADAPVYFPGAAFMLAALCYVVAIGLFARMERPVAAAV